MVNWLITGGCGFIGTSLVRALNGADPATHIRVVDNLSVGTKEALSLAAPFTEGTVEGCIDGSLPDRGVALVNADIRDAEDMARCCNGIDRIVHLAANTGVGPSVEEPRLDMEQNVIGTFNMLEAACVNKVTTFIFASSGAPAGEVEPPIHEELAPHPVSPYGASKLAGEAYCSAYGKTFGINTIALRFGNVYGPYSGHKSSVVAKFIRQALAGEICEIYGDGRQTRDFIYIDDLIRALLLAADSGLGGETFQIASGREHTVGEVAEMIREGLKAQAGVLMRVGYREARLGDVKRNYSDTSKAQRMLGWRAEQDLREGIGRTIAYFLEK